jgi:hypothetical protein
MIMNAAILFPFIGILHGLTLSLSGEKLAGSNKNMTLDVLFVLGIGVLVYSYGTAMLQQGYSGLIDTYIFSSISITIPFVAGLVIWCGRNIYYSIRARHSNASNAWIE